MNALSTENSKPWTGNDKPVPCWYCNSGHPSIDHIEHWYVELPNRRWAQVQCRVCDARGPKIEFVLSDARPHIQAEDKALRFWNGLHGKHRTALG